MPTFGLDRDNQTPPSYDRDTAPQYNSMVPTSALLSVARSLLVSTCYIDLDKGSCLGWVKSLGGFGVFAGGGRGIEHKASCSLPKPHLQLQD